jgi:hypothetical protein
MDVVVPVVTVGAVLVIGLGASLAAFPAGAVSFPTRLASVFGLGCAVGIFTGTVLVLLGIFEPVAVTVLLAVVTAACFVGAFRRSSPREHLSALREELGRDSVVLWLGLAVLLFVAILWLDTPEQPLRGGWRYWADGLELADRGGIPEFTAQWSVALPVAISKVGGNAFLGELSFLFRESPFVGMGVALWLSAVGYAAGLFALGRELGLRWTAPALPLLGIASSELPGGIVLSAGEASSKFMFYEHEDLGRMLAAVAAAVIVSRGEEERPLGRMIAGGVLLSAAALTHLIPAVVFAALIGGILVARVALLPKRARTAKLAGGTALVAVALTVTPLAAAKGEIGFEGAGNPGKYTLFRGNKDPTAAVKGIRRPPRLKSESRWYRPPLTTTRLAAEAAVGRELTRAGAATLGLIGILASVVIIVFGSNYLRTLVGGAAGVTVAILGIALFFSFRYAFYAQATFGERRLFEYASLPLILLVLGVLEVASARLARRSVLVGGAFALAVTLGAALASAGDAGLLGKDLTRPSPSVTAAVTTPCDSRLLVGGGRTRGSFQSLTGRISLTEGLEPFLRPEIVNEVLNVRAATARFLRNPDRYANVLTEREVDFVIANRRAALDEARDLSFVREIDGVAVYEVLASDADRNLPRPPESAGYHCFHEVPD